MYWSTENRYAHMVSLLLLLLIPVFLATNTFGQIVTEKQARIVPLNWVHHIIRTDGKWGSSRTAEVVRVEKLPRGDEQLGTSVTLSHRVSLLFPLLKDMRR